MLCNDSYDSDCFLESIISVQGWRYNVPPDSETEVLFGRNISKDDVAGYFKALVLSDEHKSILTCVNNYLVADTDMIVAHTEIKFKQFKKIKEICIKTGLIFENKIKTNEKEHLWYLIDTGGVYALEEMEQKYNNLPFTLSLEQKYKQYLKSLFAYQVANHYELVGMNSIKDKYGHVYIIELIEEVRISKIGEYDKTVFLVNMDTINKLGINKYVRDIAKELNKNQNMFYDISGKKFLKISN